jgi:predicted NAD-dependent protein-ADP-ribosyltransferase YbiA (DUF1768 family)
MHAAKALTFADFTSFAKIMQTTHPAKAKALGRQVRNQFNHSPKNTKNLFVSMTFFERHES